MRQETVLRTATFDPKVKTYWLLNGVLVLTLCIVTIPLVPIWYFLGMAFTERYLKSLSCVLTERNLQLQKGVWFKVQKTVPLEKITDLGQMEGPIMRWLGLKSMTVETAGQSAAGALVHMVGVEDAEGFRDAVLDQRDRMMGAAGAKEQQAAALAAPSPSGASEEVLREILATLKRIEDLTRERGA